MEHSYALIRIGCTFTMHSSYTYMVEIKNRLDYILLYFLNGMHLMYICLYLSVRLPHLSTPHQLRQAEGDPLWQPDHSLLHKSATFCQGPVGETEGSISSVTHRFRQGKIKRSSDSHH
jgi:hypothetical protein